jgi:hypothetical protein
LVSGLGSSLEVGGLGRRKAAWGMLMTSCQSLRKLLLSTASLESFEVAVDFFASCCCCWFTRLVELEVVVALAEEKVAEVVVGVEEGKMVAFAEGDWLSITEIDVTEKIDEHFLLNVIIFFTGT